MTKKNFNNFNFSKISVLFLQKGSYCYYFLQNVNGKVETKYTVFTLKWLIISDGKDCFGSETF